MADQSKSIPKPPPNEAELGVAGDLPFSGWSVNGEVPLVNRIPIDDVIHMLRTDGQARALLRLFTLPILSALNDGKWNADDGGEKEAEFANNMWTLPPQDGGMTSSKTQIVRRTLFGLVTGFSVFEEVRQVPKDGTLKGKITLRKLAYRDCRTVRFKVDDNGGFNGIRQVSNVNGITKDVQIPPEKIWFWTYQPEENPLYGVSLFEAAHYHYNIKKKLYYIAHLAAQFAAIPGRVGKVPKGYNPGELRAFKKALSDFAFNTAMVMPDGYEVTPFNGNSGFNFINLIDHHNHMMSKSVLASFLDNDQRAALIEIGQTDPNTDFFVLALEAIMDDMAEGWSRYLMPKYIDWNFGTKKYPKFQFGTLSDAAKATIKDVFTAVVTSSVLNCTPEFMRELEKKLSKSLDLDIDYDEIEKQEKDIAEQQAKAQEDEAKALQNGTGPGQQPDPNQPPGQPQDGSQPPTPGTQPPAPGNQPPATGNQPPNGGGSPVGLTNVTIDDLVLAAQNLLLDRPEGEVDEEVLLT